MGLSSHVLDTSCGRPAANVELALMHRENGDFAVLARASTNSDGRARFDAVHLEKGVYQLTFHTDAYFRSQGTVGFYPVVHIVFEVTDPTQHYHVPLLLSPFGYATYRGS